MKEVTVRVRFGGNEFQYDVEGVGSLSNFELLMLARVLEIVADRLRLGNDEG